MKPKLAALALAGAVLVGTGGTTVQAGDTDVEIFELDSSDDVAVVSCDDREIRVARVSWDRVVITCGREVNDEDQRRGADREDDDD